MIAVTKGNSTVQVRDNNQLAAYLNNGWEKAQAKPAKAKPALKKSEAAEDATPAETEQETAAKTDENESAEKPVAKRGRKSTKAE